MEQSSHNKGVSTLKLEFLTEELCWFRPVLKETKMVEETIETIIPDSCPDVTESLFAGGMAFIRGKEQLEGRLTVSVGVSATALAIPEGRTEPEVLEVYIPMSAVFESAEITGGRRCCAAVELRRVDSHLVNPRKVMLRATVAVTVQVYEEIREEHPGSLMSGNAELLEQKQPLRVLTALGEKTYTAEDTVPLSMEGSPGKIVDTQVEISHGDARLSGTRVVFRGTAQVRILCLGEDNVFSKGEGSISFSQYIDLGDTGEEDQVSLETHLAGADVDITGDGNLNVTLQLHSCARVWGDREIKYFADGYCLSGELTPETMERQYTSMLDRQYFSPVGSCEVSGVNGQAKAVRLLPQDFTMERNGERVEFVMPVQVQVLVEGKDGSLSSRNGKGELRCVTQAAKDCEFQLKSEGLEARVMPSAGGMEVQITGTLCLCTFASAKICEITGGEIEEETEKKEAPGLVIRRVAEGDSLWSLAKRYRTTSAAIRSANALGEDACLSGLLLIPRQSAAAHRNQ